MSRFIKSKISKVAYNRDYITYIRQEKNGGMYRIMIGYAPCNDAYKEIALAESSDINQIEALLDRYLEELEEEPIQDYLSDIVSVSSDRSAW